MGTVPRTPPNPYITSFLAQLRRPDGRPAAEATVSTYGGVLRKLDADLRQTGGLIRANAEEITAAICHGKRAGQRVRRAAVRSFFAWACDPNEPRLDWNPALLLPPIQRPRGGGRAVATAQLADILSRADEPYRTWYILAAGAGLRCVEIANLNREHIDPDLIWVNGKGEFERYVPTHEMVWAAVEHLPPGPIARMATSDRRATRRSIIQRGNRHLHVRLGYRLISMHGFRRWYATNIHAAAGDVFVTQELLGHASPNTTQVYVDVAAEKKRAATAALPLPLAS